MDEVLRRLGDNATGRVLDLDGGPGRRTSS